MGPHLPCRCRTPAPQTPQPASPSGSISPRTVFDIQASRWDTQECDGGIRVNPYAPPTMATATTTSTRAPGSCSWPHVSERLLATRHISNGPKRSTAGPLELPAFTPEFAVYYGLPLTGGHCNLPVKFEYTFNQAAFRYGSAVAYNAVCLDIFHVPYSLKRNLHLPQSLISAQTSSDTWRKRVEGHLERFSTFLRPRGSEG